MSKVLFIALGLACFFTMSCAFVSRAGGVIKGVCFLHTPDLENRFGSPALLAIMSGDETEVSEAKVVVTGKSIQGPYYRALVKQEATMMRRLVGSFTEREDGQTTDIVVQGKSSSVKSFVRFLKGGMKKVDVKDPAVVESVEFTEDGKLSEINDQKFIMNTNDLEGQGRAGMGGVYVK